MISLRLNDLNNIKYRDFSLQKINDNKFRLLYKNSNFIIDTETEIKYSKIYKQNNFYKLEFILNENEDGHRNFIENINSLYNILSEIIEENKIFVLQLNNLFTEIIKIKDFIHILFCVIIY